MNDDEQPFIDRARHSLEQRLEQTPTPVAARLRTAREQALDSSGRRSEWQWLPATVTAVLLLAVVVGIVSFNGSEQAVPALARVAQPAQDFEMLTQGDDLALYADMDFYLWLDKRGLNAG